MAPLLGSGNPGWMGAVAAQVPGPDPSVAVPAGHTACPVVQLGVRLEVRLESDGRAAPYPEQFAASFFVVHAAARLVVSEAPVVLPVRFVSAEE